MKNNPKTELVNVRWLSEHLKYDRDTVARRLRGVPFVAGPHRAKMYDREIAIAVIESRDGDLATLVRERVRKAEIERELRQIQLDEKRAHLLPDEFILQYSSELVIALRSEINNWPVNEAAKQRCFLRRHDNRD